MAVDFKAKLEAINKELQQIANNYNEATQVAKNCEQKIYELKEIFQIPNCSFKLICFS